MVTLIMMAITKTPTNNFPEAFNLMARLVLAEKDELNLNPYQAASLEQYVAAGSQRDWNNFEFRVSTTSSMGEITMYVRFVSDMMIERFNDAEGNSWQKLVPEVEINWPSFGSSTVAIAEQRISQYSNVVRFAKRLEAELLNFGEINQMVHTAEENKKIAAKNVSRTAQFAVEETVRKYSKSLRAGGTDRYVSHGQMMKPLHMRNKLPFTQVPNGLYEVEQSGTGRKYTVDVTDMGGVIQRTF